MNLTHDIIKIKYVREGYLPNWPHHLISDEEMCDAFLSRDDKNNVIGYFNDTYPNVDNDLLDEYNELISSIEYHISNFLKSKDSDAKLPNWIYSYMLGNVVGPNSDIQDIHDLLVMLNADNLDDIFTPLASRLCYQVSSYWIKKLSPTDADHRSASVFGELHVIKSLRLSTASEIPYTVE